MNQIVLADGPVNNAEVTDYLSQHIYLIPNRITPGKLKWHHCNFICKRRAVTFRRRAFAYKQGPDYFIRIAGSQFSLQTDSRTIAYFC